MKRRPIGDILVQRRALSEEQLEKALNDTTSEPIITRLTREGVIRESEALRALSEQSGFPGIDLNQTCIRLTDLLPIPRNVAERLCVLPVLTKGNQVFVAMADPADADVRSQLEFNLHKRVFAYIAPRGILKRTIAQAYDLRDAEKRYYVGAACPPEVLAEHGIDDVRPPLPSEVPPRSPRQPRSQRPPASPPSARPPRPIRPTPNPDLFDPAMMELSEPSERASMLPDESASLLSGVPSSRSSNPNSRPARSSSPRNPASRPGSTPRPPRRRSADRVPRTVARRSMPSRPPESGDGPGPPSDRSAPRLSPTPPPRGRAAVRPPSAPVPKVAPPPSARVPRLSRPPAPRERPPKAQAASPVDQAAARAHVETAMKLCKAGDFDRAVAALREAVKANPEEFHARYQLALLYGKRGRAYDAIEHMEAAVEIRARHFGALKNLAVLYQRAGFRRRAYETWQACLAATKDDAARGAIERHLRALS